jgi:hypothetical protein
VTEPQAVPIDPHHEGQHPWEFAVNIWGYMDSTLGLVYALAGKAYATIGDEDEILLLLRGLAGTDYLTAPRMALPDRFQVAFTDGTTRHDGPKTYCSPARWRRLTSCPSRSPAS